MYLDNKNNKMHYCLAFYLKTKRYRSIFVVVNLFFVVNTIELDVKPKYTFELAIIWSLHIFHCLPQIIK